MSKSHAMPISTGGGQGARKSSVAPARVTAARSTCFYSFFRDPDQCDDVAPEVGEVLRLVPLSRGGAECAEVEGKREFKETTDHLGTCAIPMQLGGAPSISIDWAIEFRRGARDVDTGVIHFCRGSPGHAFGFPEKHLVHSIRREILTSAPPTSSDAANPSGLAMFIESSAPRMDVVRLTLTRKSPADAPRLCGQRREPPLPLARALIVVRKR